MFALRAKAARPDWPQALETLVSIAMTSSVNPDAPTTFDSLLAKAKRDLEEIEASDAPADSGAATRLKAIFDAALHEAGAVKDSAAQKLHDGAEKVREQIKANPMAAISTAFAAGYLIGKTMAGRVKK